ncbi:hypothetical protein [Microbacterium sp. P5_E9]
MAIHRALGVRRIAIGVVAAFVLAGAAAVPAVAATGFDETELEPTAGAVGSQFGYSVAVDGNLAVVGTFLDDVNGDDSGSVSVYQRDGAGTWGTGIKLLAPDGTARDGFGLSVAVDDGLVVVGAPRDDENGVRAGSAYVYQQDDSGVWVGTKLANGAAGDQYGYSVAVDGGLVVVGAPNNDQRQAEAGAVWLYERNALGDWVGTPTVAYDGTPGDFFGGAVAAGGGLVVVGAFQDDEKGAGAGSAYLYERGSDGLWSATKLTATDSAINNGYGFSVATDGGRIVVGANGDDEKAPNAGAAYVYSPATTTAGWTATKLTATDAATGDAYGSSVAVDGGVVVVGAYGAAVPDGAGGVAGHAGAAYVYKPVGSGLGAGIKLTASAPEFFDEYGWSVAVDDSTVVVGAFTDEDLDRAGSVYVYEMTAGGVPPVITVPAPITVPATMLAGALVTYVASATDAVDGVVPLECAPLSGSVFGPGTTVVNCTATDLDGNPAQASFDVIVNVPAGAAGVTLLVQGINGLGLPKKVAVSLAAPLKQAVKVLTDNKRGNDGTACGKLLTFQASLEPRTDDGTLSRANADLLYNYSAALTTSLGCTTP